VYDAWGGGSRGDHGRAPSRAPRPQSPDEMLSNGRALHGVSRRAPTRLPHQSSSPRVPSPRLTFGSNAYRTPHRAPAQRAPPTPSQRGQVPEYSPASLANRRLPITPASAYTATKRRERKPLAGSWHKVLGSPSPPPGPEEWSTLPPKRQRITMHPDLSRPKSSKFRLPINLLSGRTLSSQALPAAAPPSQPREPSVYSGPVTITKWTPSALNQLPSAESSSTPQRGYVPSNMRALEGMGETLSPERFPQPPAQHSSQRTPYFTPQAPRVGSNSYQTQPRGASAYPTPRSLAPAAQEEDEDDWEDAWRLSANGKGAVGTSGGW
jgi:hypothetical protein